MTTSHSVNTFRGNACPPSIGLTASVLPEAQVPITGEGSHTGVSTRYAHICLMASDFSYAKSIRLDISDINQIDFKNPVASSKKVITSLMYVLNK